MFWQTSRFLIDLARPKVMGIVNLTPDSFSDGGHLSSTKLALAHCESLLADGADILDIGGESSRPGAAPLSFADEKKRVWPILLEAVNLGVPVSLDTYKPQLMQMALDLGVDIINDIWALRWRETGVDNEGRGDRTALGELTAGQVVAKHPNCGVCLMHMHGDPASMQRFPMQGDAVSEVLSFLKHQAEELRALGVDSNRIVIDPGIGFGKTVAQNFTLLARQDALCGLGFALLAGWSRKSSLAAVSGASLASIATLDNRSRLVPSVVAAVLAVQRGARIVRVHDVRETLQALKVLAASG